MNPTQPLLEIGMLLYPGLTLLDLIGPQSAFSWFANTLSAFGAGPVDARVAVDRNRITGGGVTAGIDFGLVLLGKFRGEQAAKLTQLALEYAPSLPSCREAPKPLTP
jgi:cyclohexyl-isocyanide hydratase